MIATKKKMKKWAGGGFISRHQYCLPVVAVLPLHCQQNCHCRQHHPPPSSSSPPLSSSTIGTLSSMSLTIELNPPLKSSLRRRINGATPSWSHHTNTNLFDSTFFATRRHSSTLSVATPDKVATTKTAPIYSITRPLHTYPTPTTLENDHDEKKVVLAVKKSPHSKLLRVCSSHNANAHFAAIEADLLRLSWKEAMNNLVNDWTNTTTTTNSTTTTKSSRNSSVNNRFGDLIELERNVTNYVMNNLKDCWHYHGNDCVDGAIDDDNDTNAGKGRRQLLSQSSLLRLHLFPYERVITSAVHKAIVSGNVGGTLPHSPPANSTAQNQDAMLLGGGSGSSSGNNNKQQLIATMTELHQRAQLLSHASHLLDAMTKILLPEIDDDKDGDGISATTHDIVPKSSSATSSVWTNHHTSCSNCHRLLVSGWLILYRQWKELNRQMLEDPLISAKDILKATADDDGGGGLHHPQREVHVWTKRWLDFCQHGSERKNVVVGGDASTSGIRGIVKSDQALLDGIVAMFATPSYSSSSSSSVALMAHDDKSEKQREYEALYYRINNLFPTMG